MKIGYKKRYMNSHLVFGLLWLLLFSLSLIFKEKTHWLDYGWLLIATLYLGTYMYQRRKGYLILENGNLRIHDLRKKHIPLNEVTHFRHFAGDYILESERQKVKINTDYLDEASLQLLKSELAKYGLEPGYKMTAQQGQQKTNLT